MMVLPFGAHQVTTGGGMDLQRGERWICHDFGVGSD
jgi:hypothetical protein